MDWKLILTLMVMLLGLVGTFAPLLPGIPLIFLAMLGYDWTRGFAVLGPYFLLAMLVLTALSILADYFSGVIGAGKYGASSWGKAGALLGGLLGLLFLPLGIIVGPLVGVLLGEMIAGKAPGEAIKSGWGVIVGIIAGTAARIIIAVIMVSSFLWRVFV